MIIRILLGLMTIGLIILLATKTIVITTSYDIEKAGKYIAEYAYFEGQRDYRNGDIRIEKVNDNCYNWIRRPWDKDGTDVSNLEYRICPVEYQ